MNSGQILKKTLPFVWAKLFLALIITSTSIALLLLLIGIERLFNNEMVDGIMIIPWLILSGIARFIVMHYWGYLVKAGHIAVIIEVVLTEKVPEDQLAYGKNIVAECFEDANMYFLIDKLISGAVRQIQQTISRLGNALDFIPGNSSVTSVLNIFVGISLNYIDECCLGYTLYKRERNPFRSGADGVVIYTQNWKSLIRTIAKVTGFLLVIVSLNILVIFVILGNLFRILQWSGVIAFILACILTWVVKFAFIDSYFLIRVMKAYMEVAPTTQITFDLYNQLSSLSSKFRALFKRGRMV